jgi:diacylglycerol kinase
MKPPSRITLWESVWYAVEGLGYAVRTQRNFRIHLCAATLVAALGGWLELPLETWALLVLTIGLVLMAEMFNTAAEALVDLASPDYHPLAKQVKDLAAGAVLLVAFVAILVGLTLLGPPLLARVRALIPPPVAR